MPLQCREVQFTDTTEVNSGPKCRAGGLMLPSTAQRLLAAASLCSSGHGHMPRASPGRDGQQSRGRSTRSAHCCISLPLGKPFYSPTSTKKKENKLNKYIDTLVLLLKTWLSDCFIIFLTSHSLLRMLFRWLSTRCLNMLKAEKCSWKIKKGESERESLFSSCQNTIYLKDGVFYNFASFGSGKDVNLKPKLPLYLDCSKTICTCVYKMSSKNHISDIKIKFSQLLHP